MTLNQAPEVGDPIRYVSPEEIQTRRNNRGWEKLLLLPGEIGMLEGEWWLCCPCGMQGSMDHQVEITNGVATVTPSVICPRGCHYFIKDGKVA